MAHMQYAELEALGILRQTKLPTSLDWMNDDEKLFMLKLLEAGELGIHKKAMAREAKAKPTLETRLYAHGMAQWERDKNGRLMFFTITLKGEEAAQTLLRVARNQSRSTRPGTERAAG